MRLSEGALSQAVEALVAGEVIGLPTETVYGLAADGTNPEAVRKIFKIKGRPEDHPLILHLGESAWLARYTSSVPESARALGAAFWPGPLSLVLRRSSLVPHVVTGGLETVAVRVPQHPIALQVLRAFGKPLAAPSANRFGEVSPTTRAHVVRDFGNEVPLVLEGGPCDVGVESTILDLSGDSPRLLRPGGVTASALAQVMGCALGPIDGTEPAVPGTLEAHYAPHAEVRLVEDAELALEVERAMAKGRIVGVFAPELLVRGIPSAAKAWATGDAGKAAHDLYAALRWFDDEACDVIFAVLPGGSGIAEAVADRLRRAAVGSRRAPHASST
jgi:L-threonylcarbamoyladenylate synthase